MKKFNEFAKLNESKLPNYIIELSNLINIYTTLLDKGFIVNGKLIEINNANEVLDYEGINFEFTQTYDFDTFMQDIRKQATFVANNIKTY